MIATNADTQSGSLAGGFTYNPAPTLTSISPPGGPTAGSTVVTITGTGFVSGILASFGGSSCTVSSSNSTQNFLYDLLA